MVCIYTSKHPTLSRKIRYPSMTKKVLALFALYMTFGVFTFVLNSCESFWSYETEICDISFEGTGAHMNEPDTLIGNIQFTIYSVRNTDLCFLPSISLFSEAHAMTKCAIFKNHLLTSSYSLSFDRPIFLANDTIPKNTNLLAIQLLASQILIDLDEKCKSVESTITFSDVLTQNLIFDTGEYTGTFMCSTDDNRQFSKSRTFVFRK